VDQHDASTTDRHVRIDCVSMKHGFFIIDFLIYFALLTLMLWLLTTLVASSSVRLQQLVGTHHKLVQAISADTVIKRILYTCPSSHAQWHVISPSALIWRHENTDCGLWYDDDKHTVMYGTGQYNKVTQTWQHSSKKIVASCIQDLRFVCTPVPGKEKQNIDVNIEIIRYTFRNTAEHAVLIKNAVALRNREITP
jgi:hypothetical protein